MAGMKRRILVSLPIVFNARGGIPRFNQLLCRALDDLAPSLGFEGRVLSMADDWSDYERSGASWGNLEFVPCRGKLDIFLRTFTNTLRFRPDLLFIGHLGMTPMGVPCAPLLPRGFGFVTMADRRDATKAIEEMDGSELDGRSLVVNVATERRR